MCSRKSRDDDTRTKRSRTSLYPSLKYRIVFIVIVRLINLCHGGFIVGGKECRYADYATGVTCIIGDTAWGEETDAVVPGGEDVWLEGDVSAGGGGEIGGGGFGEGGRHGEVSPRGEGCGAESGDLACWFVEGVVGICDNVVFEEFDAR